MAIKQAFIDSWDNHLPDGVLDFAETPIDFTGVTYPTTIDESIIEQGKLAAKLNKIFDDLQGFTFVDLILHIGQRNQINKLAAMAGYEANVEQVPYDFLIDAPDPGDTFTSPVLFSVTITGGVSDAFSVQISIDEDVVDMVVDENEPAHWSAVYPVENSEPQEFTATIEVIYVSGTDEFTVEHTVDFTAYLE